MTGADARIVTVRDNVLDASWLGRRLTLNLLADLDAAGSDPCGEHGEYHTVVVDAPAFSSPLDLVPLDQVSRGGCWALDFTIDEGRDEREPCCTRLSCRTAIRPGVTRDRSRSTMSA